MSVQEYTDEMFYSELASDSHDEGIQEANDLYSWLFSINRGGDVQKATSDPLFFTKLLAEYNEWKEGQK